MQALILQNKKKPKLSKGIVVLPIQRSQSIHISIRILRAASKSQSKKSNHYISLISIPDEHPVSVIIGKPKFNRNILNYTALNRLKNEDKELLEESFKNIDGNVPKLSSSSLDWVARLVLGESLPKSCIKWTKDIRLLERGAKNPAIKK